MTSLQTRISKSPELKTGWLVISHELDEWLKDLATSVEYTSEKTNEEIGQSTRIFADLRRRISQASSDAPVPKKPQIRKLNPLPQPER